MAGTGEICELILSAAQGVTGGLTVLRAAGMPSTLGGFTVEIDYDGAAAPGAEVGAAIRISIVAPALGPSGSGDNGSAPAACNA